MSLLKALGVAIRHLFLGWYHRQRYPLQAQALKESPGGPVTVPYPQAQLPLPENGHYRLEVVIEDCIGCDRCARICPVGCITIEKHKSPTVLGYTSTGAPRRFALPRFDIDHALCCFCGLCTIVCPTDCIFMVPDYAYATPDRATLVHRFGESFTLPSESAHGGGGTGR
ncbi:MAG: 4Fe-4S binding protein [Bacteroidia bacterium]|nr:4Fe-4S binding protein [Bacteroidia bacterium]MDW8088375.1 4Fe-4S binding protein [Bacteroidia bacterium]